MSIPHGMPGKPYALTCFVIASVILTAISVAIIIAPFWIIATVFAVMVIAAMAGILSLSRVSSGEG